MYFPNILSPPDVNENIHLSLLEYILNSYSPNFYSKQEAFF